MKLFTFLAVSALAIHSSAGTLKLAKNIVEKTVANTDSLIKKVLNTGNIQEATSYDIHIARQPVCTDCSTSQANPPSRPSFPVKGRYYFYPSSYYYPSTAFYYYPSYVPAQASSTYKPSAQRRVGHALYSQPSPFNQAYFVYPSNVNSHKDVKPVQVHDFYNPGYSYHPFQFYPVAAPATHGQVSPFAYHGVVPPFSQLVRQKSGRPYVSPKNRGFGGFKGSSGGDGGTKGGSSTTTEPTEQQQQQEQEEEQTTDDPVKGGRYY